MTILSGMGSVPAGAAPAGYDAPVYTSSLAASLAPQRQAVLYDPATRGAVRDPATGMLRTVHWVDQAVALALTVNAGSLSANTTLGNRLRAIPRSAGPRVRAEVEDAVREALSALLDRKDIGVTSVGVASPVRGQITVVVSYVNLRLTPNVPRDIKFVF